MTVVYTCIVWFQPDCEALLSLRSGGIHFTLLWVMRDKYKRLLMINIKSETSLLLRNQKSDNYMQLWVSAVIIQTFAGGPIGGCQLDNRGQGTPHSMGYVQGQPYAIANTLTVRYTGGEICHKGTAKQSYRSTRIDFHCASVEVGYNKIQLACSIIYILVYPIRSL